MLRFIKDIHTLKEIPRNAYVRAIAYNFSFLVTSIRTSDLIFRGE